MEKYYKKIGLYFYYLLKILILVGLVAALIRQEWGTAFMIAFIFALTYVPTIVKSHYRLSFPLEFDLIIVTFIFLATFLGDIQNYYDKFWWWDIYLHGGSGFLLGIIAYILVYVLNEQRKIHLHMKAGFVSIFAFAFSMTIAGLWEIFEFAMDQIFGFNMQRSGLVDTMWDMIAAAIGSFVIAFLGYLWMKKKIKSFYFDKSIKKFIRKNKHLFKE